MKITNHYNELMKTYYDVRAPWHDQYMSYQSNEQMETLQKPIIELFQHELANKTVLEIACGTGNWTGILAKRAKHITAVDSSPQSIILAQKKLNRFKNIDFIETDIFNAHNLLQKYDFIFSADFFSHVPMELISKFIEIVRSISSNDTKLITVDMVSNNYFEQEPNYTDNNGNRVSTRELPNGEQFEVIKNFFTEKRLREHFSAFHNVKYFEFKQLQRWMTICTNNL